MHDSANVSSDFVDGRLSSTLSWDGLHRHLALIMLAYSFLIEHPPRLLIDLLL